jgi:AraC-like DNA-binding protein
MSTALAVYHGRFGRATLYRLNRPMTVHAHREGHLIFHVRGAMGIVDVCGRPFALAPRAAVAVNPWEPHAFLPGRSDEDGLFLVLYIDPRWFGEVQRGARPALRFGSSGIAVDDRVGEALDRATRLMLERRSIELLDRRLYDLTDRCFAESWRNPDAGSAAPDAPAADGPSDFRVRRSIQLLSDRLGEGREIRLDAVAREAGLSRPHFYHLFRRQTGVTPNLYRNTLLMERAVEILTRTARTVTEIGFDLGFSSQSGFTRFFSANVGMAPTDYRRVALVLPS